MVIVKIVQLLDRLKKESKKATQCSFKKQVWDLLMMSLNASLLREQGSQTHTLEQKGNKDGKTHKEPIKWHVPFWPLC